MVIGLSRLRLLHLSLHLRRRGQPAFEVLADVFVEGGEEGFELLNELAFSAEGSGVIDLNPEPEEKISMF